MEEQYEYKHISKSTCGIKNNKITFIDDVLNNYAKQGYKVIHITYNACANMYSCILERKIVKKQTNINCP